MRLDKKQTAALRNRFYAMKNRAAKTGREVQWDKFREWLRDFLIAAPEDFTLEKYRIYYDLSEVEYYCAASLRVAEYTNQRFLQGDLDQSPKRVIHLSPKQAESLATNMALKVLFSAELTRRLMEFKPDETLDQILVETAQSVGLQLGDDDG